MKAKDINKSRIFPERNLFQKLKNLISPFREIKRVLSTNYPLLSTHYYPISLPLPRGLRGLFILLCFLPSFLWAQEEPNIVKVGDMMPAFTIVSDEGSKLSSAVWDNKVVLVTFFATWCPPCQKELAAFEETLWPTFKDRNDFVLAVIGREHSDAELATYNEKKGFTFPLYPDKNRAIYSKFANSLIPRTYLIGKDGKVIYAGSGFNKEAFNSLMDKIHQAIK